MSRVTRTVFAFVFSFAICLPAAFGQDSQDPGAAPVPKKLDKDTKRKMKRTLKELDNAYKLWLTEDVTYIITPDERNAFLQLDTNEEREQFIEQFWLRRSSNPDLPDNDFKEEHYRRIAYANEHYASGIPGWKTDRGRMYIMWGPADEVESHPTGGTYDRPMEEGGGSTSTYPWETWRWRYLEGIGENVILEFVDPSGSGEYHLTMDPSEKDALLHVPGAGLSLMESMGMASKTDRFTRSDGTNLPTAMGGTPASMDEFNRLELYAKVNKAPEVKFKDLEAVVTSRIVRDQMHFNRRTDYLKVTNDTVLVPIAVAEIAIDLSEGRAPASRPVSLGSGTERRTKWKCRRRKQSLGRAPLPRRQARSQLADSCRPNRARPCEANRHRPVRAGFLQSAPSSRGRLHYSGPAGYLYAGL